MDLKSCICNYSIIMIKKKKTVTPYILHSSGPCKIPNKIH